ncbi:MAP3K12-binding inhibitory protein 1 [Spea bombifrons]|uniref:MAP3K12-binding inhibitory protein 1 n=1 Tax=Spea bombifrons TaxID=233779 RepID=UPI00234B7D81|nr:MAP3K12-binding inhibitory protein 1 [Spea bombifrons]
MAAAEELDSEILTGFRPPGCTEIVRDVLRSVERCIEQLNLKDKAAVAFAVDWEKVQCLRDEKPSRVSSALQQHIADLQPLLGQLQTLAAGESERNKAHAAKQESMEIDICEKTLPTPTSSDMVMAPVCSADPAVVQIKAKKAEIDRRILAFIERKQAEINENNVREFCNVIDCNQENSCARTDAVFTPYPGLKSHIKVSRVVNMYGPQTRSENSTRSDQRSNPLHHECTNQAVEERLKNMECHLQLQKGGPVPKDIYQRIKRLEDRILALEGISPEYFQSLDVPIKRKKPQTSQSYSLAELDQKINALRHSLLQKGES